MVLRLRNTLQGSIGNFHFKGVNLILHESYFETIYIFHDSINFGHKVKGGVGFGFSKDGFVRVLPIFKS